MLVACRWVVQNFTALNLGIGQGIALREVPLKSGRCDYLLLVNRKPVGVIEAKRAGTTLSTVADQSGHYGANLPEFLAQLLPSAVETLPFLYESTGTETFFRDERDPHPRSRPVFSFHRPETLAELLTKPHTLRHRLAQLPFAHPLATDGMRDCQVEAITHLEESFRDARSRALIQMATGAGKTFTACAFTYRLIKHAGAKRVLFLVDRANLGRQAKSEFDQFVLPNDGRKFTAVYNVQHLTSNKLDDVCRVTICTIQRLYSMLRGEELDEDLDEKSGYEIASADDRPKDVAYNPAIPIETFDFIVTDECHRSIYNLWRQVLEYFDAFLIGLTATPSKQTIGFFNQNLVTEYNHERAVADGVNVGYEVYRIKTQVTEQGGTIEKGWYVDRRHKETRRVRWERLDEDLTFTARELDRSIVVQSQIRTVLQEAFKKTRQPRSSGAGQRALRRRRRRDDQARVAQAGRRPHPSAPAHRYLLRTGGEGERPLLRPKTCRRQTGVDDEALDLRPMNEPTLHAQRKPAKMQQPRRLRRLLPPKESNDTQQRARRWKPFTYDELTKRDKLNLDLFRLKDDALEDRGQPPRAGDHRRGDCRRPGGGPGAIRDDRGGFEKIGLPVFRRFTPSLPPAHVGAIRALLTSALI